MLVRAQHAYHILRRLSTPGATRDFHFQTAIYDGAFSRVVYCRRLAYNLNAAQNSAIYKFAVLRMKVTVGPSLAVTKLRNEFWQAGEVAQMPGVKSSERKRSRGAVQPTCSVCECQDNFNYTVPDELWKKVIVSEHQESVVCLKCFDNFAFQKGIDYAASIENLYFAGDKAVFKFRSVAARDI